MPGVLIWSLVFLVSLIFLVKSSDWFIDAAEDIGLSFGIPSFIIGLTIVALGTSIPELAGSLVAVKKGSSEIVVSNVVGSNITNVFLVLGVVFLVSSRRVLNLKFNLGDVLLLSFSAGIITYGCFNDQVFSFNEALICVLGIFAYIGMQLRNYFNTKEDDATDKPPFKFKSVLILMVSIVLIALSAEYNIESIIKLSEILGIGKEIISLSAVALGTSLPELFVSLSAAKKGSIEVAFGNLVGSNILNVFAVMGIPGLIGRLAIPDVILGHGLFLMLIATAALVLVLIFRKFQKWQGIVLLMFYGYFFYVLISHNLTAVSG